MASDRLDERALRVASLVSELMEAMQGFSVGSIEPWIPIDDAALHAGVSEATIRRWVAQGLEAGQRGGILRFRRSTIDSWLLSGQAEAETARPPAPTGEAEGTAAAAAEAILASLEADRAWS